MLQKQLQELEQETPEPVRKYDDYMIYVNAGHGGIHPETGEYRTFKSHGKFYEFTDGAGNIIFKSFEGETNRLIAEKFIRLLELEGIPYMRVYHPFEDRTNQERTAIANAHYQSKSPLGLWLSFHSNAFGISSRGPSQSPRGFSIFTSRGATLSDLVADVWFVEHQKLAGNSIQYRLDLSDRDKDFEADFHELIWTNMPAVLVENLFFTNIEDARLLYSEAYQELSARACFNTVMRTIEAGILKRVLA